VSVIATELVITRRVALVPLLPGTPDEEMTWRLTMTQSSAWRR
jgi:hypothetical protein